jgi:hypothetical protein
MSEYPPARQYPVRQYIVFDAIRLLGAERSMEVLTTQVVEDEIQTLLRNANISLSPQDYKFGPVPLVKFFPGDIRIDVLPPFTPQAVVSITSPDVDASHRVRRAFVQLLSVNSAVLSIGVDPALGGSEYGTPTASDGALFSTVAQARDLIRANLLPPSLDGHDVNVVVVDSGFDSSVVPAGQFGGGWQPDPADPSLPLPLAPGTTKGPNALHGIMMVQTILAMAPKARIYDVPLIPPPKVYDIYHFLIAAEAAYQKMVLDIRHLQRSAGFQGSWIFVNAWGIYDRRSEEPFLGDYTQNLGFFGVRPHPFIRRIEHAARHDFDLVFAAGNCGEYCPDNRCGPNDYGPGRSIWGANAHKDVLTTGAVRIDRTWTGYSSEGPGPTPYLHHDKPDLSVPTQFMGTSGLYPPGTGTSCSAGVAAGIVAALRTQWHQNTVRPAALQWVLNSTAAQPYGTGWNPSFGNGILDAFAAYQKL